LRILWAIAAGVASYPQARLYKTETWPATGDGSIEFLGRIDHQVKSEALIELAEIEAVLESTPAVRETVVGGVEDELW